MTIEGQRACAKPSAKFQSRAYSYIRFSTPEQLKGDSLRRQLRKGQKYCEKRGLILDESLSLQDLGLSAYHGVHVEKGALGVFLELVCTGRIPTGSFLIIENLDRFSRQKPRVAMRMFLDLIDAGVTIVTLTNEKEHSAKSLDNDPDSLASSLGEMIRAFGESDRKAGLLADAWEEKRVQASDGGPKLTAKCPAWLKLSEDRSHFIVFEERAEIIRLVFKMKLDGKGTKQIAREFNTTPNFPWMPVSPKHEKVHGWWPSYIEKILRFRAVIGEYQPHRLVGRKREPIGEPIRNYYPAIVPEDLFYEVQALFKTVPNKKKGGTVGLPGGNSRNGNLFVHIAKCGYCGASMHFLDKSPGTYYVCSSALRRAGCKFTSVKYPPIEEAVLRYCLGLDPAELLPGHEERESRIRTLQGQLTTTQAKIEEAEEHAENLLDQIEGTKPKELRDRYEARLQSILDEQSALKAHKEALQREFEIVSRSDQDVRERLESLAQLFDAMKTLTGQELVNLKLRLRQEVKRLIKRIAIYAEGYPRITKLVAKALADTYNHVVNPKHELKIVIEFQTGIVRAIWPHRDAEYNRIMIEYDPEIRQILAEHYGVDLFETSEV